MRERRERPVAVGILAGSLAFGLFAVGYMAFTLAVSLYFAPRAARASTVYGSLGIALVLVVSLFLFDRLTAAELNATPVERRHASRSS